MRDDVGMREASRRWKDSACKMARMEREREREKAWKGKRPRSKRAQAEKETSLAHEGRRGLYTERQWYDERIGGWPWNAGGGKRERKGRELR